MATSIYRPATEDGTACCDESDISGRRHPVSARITFRRAGDGTKYNKDHFKFILCLILSAILKTEMLINILRWAQGLQSHSSYSILGTVPQRSS
jgi:hypothetical protein